MNWKAGIIKKKNHDLIISAILKTDNGSLSFEKIKEKVGITRRTLSERLKELTSEDRTRGYPLLVKGWRSYELHPKFKKEIETFGGYLTLMPIPEKKKAEKSQESYMKALGMKLVQDREEVSKFGWHIPSEAELRKEHPEFFEKRRSKFV